MRNGFILFVVFALIVLNSSLSFAYSHEQFQRGARHIYNAPQQVREGFRTEPDKAKFAPVGYVGGAVKGTAYMGVDIVTGIFEILTSALSRNDQQR